MGRPEDAAQLANSLHVERPYYEPGLLLGTSAFTAAGWEGSFYPAGMKPRDRLSYYSRQFATVEIDSTYYGAPSGSTVTAWYEKTPPDFVFAAKVPSICCGPSYVVLIFHRVVSRGLGVEQHHITSSR